MYLRLGEGQASGVAYARCRRQCIEAISPHEARKKIFTFIFQLSGRAIVASSCFVLRVPDV